MTNLLASDSEAMFLWELDQARKHVHTMAVRSARPVPALRVTRKPVAFRHSVRAIHAAATDSVRMRPAFAPHACPRLGSAQALVPLARVPSMGFT